MNTHGRTDFSDVCALCGGRQRHGKPDNQPAEHLQSNRHTCIGLHPQVGLYGSVRVTGIVLPQSNCLTIDKNHSLIK